MVAETHGLAPEPGDGSWPYGLEQSPALAVARGLLTGQRGCCGQREGKQRLAGHAQGVRRGHCRQEEGSSPRSPSTCLPAGLLSSARRPLATRPCPPAGSCPQRGGPATRPCPLAHTQAEGSGASVTCVTPSTASTLDGAVSPSLSF